MQNKIISHLEKIETYEDYSYVYYSCLTPHLKNTYQKFEKEIEKLGYFIADHSKEISGGILLENSNETIAGIFYSSVHPTTIKILSGFVKEEYRSNKIYKTLHKHLNAIARQNNKKNIISTIHVNNNLMIDSVAPKLGYEVVCYIVHKKISSNS
jgi:predicted GNAT family acetyltransferase